MANEAFIMSAMLLAIYLTVLVSLRSKDTWGKLVSFSSLSTKASIFLVALGVLKELESITTVGVLYLLVSGASVMLLSYFLGRKER
ncbi:MAG: hypothetical protein DRP27_03595 [Thermotogae bacterium]|nr:MAG: hypothetical protein DRP27_03595 [Thermotogota bacterium]